MANNFIRTLLIACLAIVVSNCAAQTYDVATYSKPPDHDTTYYRSFKGTIIVRTYLSRNYMQYKLEPHSNLPTLGFHAHNPLNLGVGFTYKSFSFSFSKGLNFLQSNKTKGITRSTDLQVHLYKRKWTIDALAEFYKGYYLNPRGLGTPDAQSYYIRPDMTVKLVGACVNRVLNDKRFCYGAGLSQNAWQQRSAGSFLIGAEAFYLAVRADSSFAPHTVDPAYQEAGFRKMQVFEIGPGAGYAYSLVLQKHYFLLGSFTANMNLRFTHEIGNGAGGTKVNFSPNYMLRFAAGYNTNKWGVNLAWLTTGVDMDGKASGYHYSNTTGNYRLVYARRLAINHKMKTIIGPDVN